MLFIEKDSRFSSYIKFEDFDSLSSDVPRLSMLRVEMERVHPGMSDFILRVATPKYAGAKKSGTVLSIRGNRDFTKYDTMVRLAKLIAAQMEKRGDETHEWSSTDADHLADMLFSPAKFFAANSRIERLGYATEALR